MKLITAIIQPEKLEDVKQALFDAKITKMTVSNVIGCGQQGGYTESYRGSIVDINLIKKVKIEIYGMLSQLISSKYYPILNGKVELNIENKSIKKHFLKACYIEIR